jgi:hypothetical protein
VVARRVVATLFLTAVAVVMGLLAWGSLSNLWADYRDSSISTYLWIGIPALTVSAGAVIATFVIWRER